MKFIIVGDNTEKQQFIKALETEYCGATHLDELVLLSYKKKIKDEEVILRYVSGPLALLKNFDKEFSEVDAVIYLDGKNACKSEQSIQDLVCIPSSIHIDYYHQSIEASPSVYLEDLVNEFKSKNTCGYDKHQLQTLMGSGHSVFAERKAPPKVSDNIFTFKKFGNV